MYKGKFGIDMFFYCVVAFALAALRQTLLCGILTGVVIFVERDEWASRQCLQAFFLCLTSVVSYIAFGILAMFSFIPFLGLLLTGALTIVFNIIYVIIIALSVYGVTKVIKGGEADLPVYSKLAYWAYGVIRQ